MVDDVEITAIKHIVNAQVCGILSHFIVFILGGTTGEYCDELIDYCSINPNPCVNGKCNPLFNSTFYCECEDGVFGENCEVILYKERRSFKKNCIFRN
jgi:hypothetical protein